MSDAYADWTDAYQERESIMAEAGVADSERKALFDTRERQLGPRPPWAWGSGAGRGWVSNARFGAGEVIPRTNREVSRKWRKLDAS